MTGPQTKNSPMGYGDADARSDGGGDGQSLGGAYPNPREHEHEPGGDAQGGQSAPKYSGPANPNAPRKSDS